MESFVPTTLTSNFRSNTDRNREHTVFGRSGAFCSFRSSLRVFFRCISGLLLFHSIYFSTSVWRNHELEIEISEWRLSHWATFNFDVGFLDGLLSLWAQMKKGDFFTFSTFSLCFLQERRFVAQIHMDKLGQWKYVITTTKLWLTCTWQQVEMRKKWN